LSPRDLGLLFRAYVAVLLGLCLLLALYLSVERDEERPERSIVSVWAAGARKARAVVEGDPGRALAEVWEGKRGTTRVIEEVIDEGPVLSVSPILFGGGFVAGADGVKVSLGDKVAYATVDDLHKLGAYDHFYKIGTMGLRLGVDPVAVQEFLAKELGVTRERLLAEGHFRRVALRHKTPPEPAPEVNRKTLRAAAIAAGRYLARMVRNDGSYRYEVDPIKNEDSPGYNWPRHSGATWYLSDVAIYSQDQTMQRAAERAARRLAGYALVDCGERRCIAEGDRADLGSSALALLAFVELVEGGLAPDLRQPILDLCAFLRSQQRPDGEFMHFYDRVAKRPIDQQVLYYTGEAAFALSRASRITKDPRDLEAGRKALAVLVERPFWYVAWRYFWGAEHWTCHAMNDLYDRAPNPKALRFCLDWQESIRNLAIRGRSASPEYEAATSGGPFVPPSLGGSSSRMEAAVSTLMAAERAGVSAREVAALKLGIEQTLGFLLRHQFLPGPKHLMTASGQMHGGFPTSPINLKVRIDNPQHAGTGLLHYLEYLEDGPHARER
jgi:hypothetical protein